MISWLSELSRSSVCCLSPSEHKLLLNFSDIPGSCSLVDPARLSCLCLLDALLRCWGFRLDLMSAGGQFFGKTDKVSFIMGPPPGFFKD